MSVVKSTIDVIGLVSRMIFKHVILNANICLIEFETVQLCATVQPSVVQTRRFNLLRYPTYFKYLTPVRILDICVYVHTYF